MDVTVEPVGPGQRALLDRLLELNAYEFSAIDGRSIGDDGRFGYPYLDLYFGEPDRWAYLIRVDGELAGFALVRGGDDERSVAEFLVLPPFRRGGVGTFAARLLFGRHPGHWLVHQLSGNEAATAFWQRAVPVPYEEETDATGRLQRFRIDLAVPEN